MHSNDRFPTCQNRRTGFTPIETLVVVGVLCLSFAVVAPGLHSARASARKTQCIANLKRIGLGLHNYHDVHRTLPPGWTAATASPGAELHHGWMVAVLPFIDEINIYKQIDLDTPDDKINVLKGRVAVYRCPADSTPQTNALRENFGTTNYSGNYGTDPLLRWAPGSLSAFWPGQVPTVESTGVFALNSRIRIRDFKDGMSNVFMVGERSLVGRSGIWAGVRGNEYEDDQVSDCSFYSQLNTETGFSSRHPGGGAHFLFGDGSVHFVNQYISSHDSVDNHEGTYQRLSDRDDGQNVGDF